MKILLLAVFLAVVLLGAQKPLPVNGGDQHKQAENQSNESKPDAQAVVAAEVNKENAANAQKYAYYKAHPNEYFRDAFAPANLSNWILAGLGVIGGVIAVITLVTFKRQTDHMIASERAWMMAELEWPPGHPDFPELNKPRQTTNPSSGEPITSVPYCLRCSNDGKTPGWIIKRRACAQIVDTVPPQPDMEQLHTMKMGQEPVKVGAEAPIWEGAIGCAGHLKDGQTLIIWGVVTYRDAFSETRETYWGYYWIPGKTGPNLHRILEPAYNRHT